MKLNEAFFQYKDLIKESIPNNINGASLDSLTKDADDVFQIQGVLISRPEHRFRTYMKITEEKITLEDAKTLYPNSNKKLKGQWYLPSKTDLIKFFPELKRFNQDDHDTWCEHRKEINNGLKKLKMFSFLDEDSSEFGDGEYWTATLSQNGKFGANINFFSWGNFAPNPIYDYHSNIPRKRRVVLFCKV